MEFDIVVFIVIITFSFLLRIAPVLIRKDLYLVDHWFHLIFAEEIRKNRLKYPQNFHSFLIKSDPLGYPFLYHYLLALFPRSVREKYSYLTSAICDSVQLIVVFIISKWIIETYNLEVPVFTPLLSAIIFAITPVFLRVGDARNIGASARAFGELFVSLSLLSTILYLSSEQTIFIITAVLFAALVLLSSKFGAQAILFISICMSVLLGKIEFIGVFILSILVAITISWGGYWRTLRGHLGHSNMQRIMSHSATLGYSELLNKFREGFSNWGQALEVLYKTPIINLVLHSPFLILLTFIFVIDYQSLKENMNLYAFLIWALSSVLVCVITSFKRAKFLGEGERYGDYAVFPVAVAIPLVISLYHNDPSYWIIFVGIVMYFVILYLVSLYMWVRIFPSSTPIDIVCDKLKVMKPSNIACIPASLCYEIGYKTDHLLLFRASSASKYIKRNLEEIEQWKIIYSMYPFLNKDLVGLTSRFDLNYFIVKKQYSYWSIYDTKDILKMYDFSFFKKYYESEEYVIYKVNT